MKKLTGALALLVLFALSCQKSDKMVNNPDDLTALNGRSCASYEVLQAQIAADPGRLDRLNAIEDFTRRAIQNGQALRISASGGVTIPVVVHVVYSSQAENISREQIESQIAVLNEDFNLNNADRNKIPSAFTSATADVGVSFTIAEIKRVPSKKRSWGTDDAVKFSTRGGSNAVDPAQYLNIWVCNLGRGLLGYAQFPGGSSATDGVVILYSAFGSRAKFSNGTYVANYDKGRTATHEIGHWLNLRHIWGDATCGNDFVGDTPLHNAANTGCPADGHKSTCSGKPLEMWMNYMDYTYDGCMYMFSNGQKERMLSTFTAGGPRATFAQ